MDAETGAPRHHWQAYDLRSVQIWNHPAWVQKNLKYLYREHDSRELATDCLEYGSEKYKDKDERI